LRRRYPDLRSEVVRSCPADHPLVLRCHPLRLAGPAGAAPFPTLFWLACDAMHRALARLEAGGLIAQLEQRLRLEPALLSRVAADHAAYVAERDSLLSPAERATLAAEGHLPDLAPRSIGGIGGIRDPATVKCLHLHYAHHLARGSALGELIAAAGGDALTPCR
jgi:hypothetical protein